MSRVPNVFHFVFGLRPQTTPFHLAHYLCLASCIGVNRPDAVYFHCLHEPWGEYWERIRPQLTVLALKPDPYVASFRYRDADLDRLRYAHLADIARLEVIVRHGGVYADMDTLFVAPLPGSLFQRSFVMGREEVQWTPEAEAAGGSLCNAWMMGKKGAPFATEWLARMHASFDGSWNAASCLLPYRLSREHPEWLHIEPQRSFFHFDVSTRGLRGIFRRRLGDWRGIYSIHLWSHLWWEAERRHPVLFHAGRLTPAYVRHARTTYALAARAFLPAEWGRQHILAWIGESLSATAEDGIWASERVKRKLTRAWIGAGDKRGVQGRGADAQI